MNNIGGGEVLVVLLLALLVLGPERLPKVARQIGDYVRQIREIASGFQNEMKGALRDEVGPFTPEETRIRPVPAIGERSGGADAQPDRPVDDLETDIRAHHDVGQKPSLKPVSDPAPAPGDDAASDERAAG